MISITTRELLDYHKDKFKTSEDLSFIREYILSNDYLALEDEVQLTDNDQVQSETEVLDLNDIDIDPESLELGDYDHTNVDVQQYIAYKAKHQKKFEQEIRQKNLTLHQPQRQQQKEAPKAPMNY